MTPEAAHVLGSWFMSQSSNRKEMGLFKYVPAPPIFVQSHRAPLPVLRVYLCHVVPESGETSTPHSPPASPTFENQNGGHQGSA